MAGLSRAMPIYEALLALAAPSERKAVVEGGDAAWLSPKLRYGDGSDGRERARRAYAAIEAILERVISDPSLIVTGIDTRRIPPVRTEIDSGLLRSGHLRWLEGEPPESQLQFDWGGDDLIKMISLRIEPRNHGASVVAFETEGPPDLIGKERKADTQRIHRMQQLVSTGMRKHAAAMRVAAEMPDPDTPIDKSVAKRLVEKFTKRQKK